MIASILSQYGPAIERLRWVDLGSGGGFSGSLLWRGDFEGQPLFALKCWPEAMPIDRLTRIHQWMNQASHLPFVPQVIPTSKGLTFVENSGRILDITRWMPGRADFHVKPSAARLANACAALAEIHRVWKPAPPRMEICPGVLRRLQILDDWKQFPRSPPSSDALLIRGINAVARLAEPAEIALLSWTKHPISIQPCLCDVWHDHLLFTGDSVTGIIDYGAMKEDHPAVDLARMLGDLIGEDEALFELGLAAYSRAGGSSEAPAEFVRLLDRTGFVGSMIVWLLRFSGDSSRFSGSPAVRQRIARLADRLDAIRGF